MNLIFVKREELAPSIWQYYFRGPHILEFVPGQYIEITLPELHDAAHGDTRVFTITSLPGQNILSFIVRIEPLRSRYKEHLERLTDTSTVIAGPPMGTCILPADKKLPILFIASGIGIASYASMFADLQRKNEIRAITLLYAPRNSGENILPDILHGYSTLKQCVVCIPPQRITVNQILEFAEPTTQLYLSGGQKFVEELYAGLIQSGVSRERIILDYYDGYTET